MAQSVERVLGKDEVTSSNLVSSSKNAVSGKLAAFFRLCKVPFLRLFHMPLFSLYGPLVRGQGRKAAYSLAIRFKKLCSSTFFSN